MSKVAEPYSTPPTALLSAVEHLDCGVAVMTADKTLLYANANVRRDFPDTIAAMEAGETVLEATLGHLKHAWADIGEEMYNKILSDFRTAIDEESSVEFIGQENRILRTYFSRAENGEIIAVTADITDERQREIELRRAKTDAQSANEAKSRFLATVSHEIRTPLNGIVGLAKALSQQEMQSEHLAMVQSISECADDLLALLNDVLDLAKVEAGRLGVSPIAMDVRERLRRSEQLFRPSAEEKGLHFRVVASPQMPQFILSDPIRLGQCLDNLISNAIKFTQTGHVLVALSYLDNCLVAHVEDTGIGITESQSAGIFDPFRQAEHTTTRRFKGTGLGLAISRELARAMGGDVTCVSEPGRGSVFTLTVNAPAADSTDAALVSSAPIVSIPSTSLRVLIVDDNTINRQVARLFVEPLGHIVTEAPDGRSALKIMASGQVDIVLMDIHMPFMDGSETLRRIRGSGQPWANVPVIALTADAFAKDVSRFLALGFDGHVAKPLEERALQQALTVNRPAKSA
ncbi:MAG: ATP-binding protein [Pseudomonadota bacterium]